MSFFWTTDDINRNTARPISPVVTTAYYAFTSLDTFKTLMFLSIREMMAVSKGNLSSFVAKTLE